MTRTPKPGALFLAGHPALDFLNTLVSVDGNLLDLLQKDQDVLIWLKKAGAGAPSTHSRPAPRNLLSSARELREAIRSLVERRKIGARGEPSVLNKFLDATRSYPQLVWARHKNPMIERVRLPRTADSVLSPLAEAAADLLANADFDLVKRCENEACTLWYLDQTKSHRRRWCSMGLCGNRYKVAAYRNRVRGRRNPDSHLPLSKTSGKKDEI